MKKLRKFNQLEAGQMIPLVVLTLLGMIAMTALILDGGALMSNRRTAQTAADAAALAGAQRACAGFADAQAVAEGYATRNQATAVEVTVVGKEVTVRATVAHSSFFARIFGEDTLTTSAEATAGCYSARGESTLPLAWYCRGRTVGGPFPADYGCQIQTISWDVLGPLVDPAYSPPSARRSEITIHNFAGVGKTYTLDGTNVVDSKGLPPQQIYIIMDKDKVCIEDGTGGDLVCDLDGDGKIDIHPGGDRGWLTNKGHLGSWFNKSFQPHVWLSGEPGNMASMYIALNGSGFNGRVVLVPVYNTLCDGDPESNPACIAAAHQSPPWPSFTGVDDFTKMDKRNGLNYHIVAFAPFYISCVSKKGTDCPGFNYARTLNPSLKHNEPVIEGFFLSDLNLPLDLNQPCDINLGSCQISLSK